MLLLVVLLVAGATADCPTTLPDGTQCPQVADDHSYTYPDPEDCSAFYECWNGCAAHLKCQLDYNYDVAHKWCNYHQDVDCGDRPCWDPVHCPGAPPTTAAASTTATTHNDEDCGHVKDCTVVESGWYEDTYNCRKYWHCLNGTGEHFTCPDDQLYDPDNVWCNFPHLVECGDRPICDDCDENCGDAFSTTEAVTTTEFVECGHVKDCTNVTDGWYEDPYNCRKYWHCLDGHGDHFICAEGLLYDPENIWCNFPQYVTCGDRPICNDCDEDCGSTEDPASSTSGTTSETDCGHVKDCSEVADGWYEDPYNCRKYWHCLGDHGDHFTCDEGLFYDPINVWCNFPEYVDCGDRPICNDCDEDCTNQSTLPPPEQCDHDCSVGPPDGFFAEGCCENSYCRCVGGLGYLMHCDPALVFVEATAQCDWPANVPCCSA